MSNTALSTRIEIGGPMTRTQARELISILVRLCIPGITESDLEEMDSERGPTYIDLLKDDVVYRTRELQDFLRTTRLVARITTHEGSASTLEYVRDGNSSFWPCRDASIVADADTIERHLENGTLDRYVADVREIEATLPRIRIADSSRELLRFYGERKRHDR